MPGPHGRTRPENMRPNIAREWHHPAALYLPLAVFAVLVCARMPEILIKGRFWAEEGEVFFRHAWDMPPIQALLTSYGGYLNLVANAAPLIARWALPLPLAPYFTIATSLLIQLCAPALLLSARDDWLRPWHVRLTAILLLLLIPATEEIWLQTLHCQFQLTLCCAVILALQPATGRAAWLRFAVLALGPLCGPTAIALIPLFIARTLAERTRARALQTAILGAAAAIQLVFFFHAVPGRGYTLDASVLLDVLTVRHLQVPFFGIAQGDIAATTIRDQRAAGQIPLMATLAPVVIFGALAAASVWQRQARPARWLLGAAALIAAANYFGAIRGAATLIAARQGERYVFVPQALLGLGLLALAATARGWTARVVWLAIIWLLVMGAWQYATPWEITTDGPSWRHEVALWRTDPTHVLKVWPAQWTVRLDPAFR